MSYDIMVIDRHKRFVKAKKFYKWFDKTTQWAEPLDYNDPSHATPQLQAWFEKMRGTIPAMNGPYANNDDIDASADYSIARDAIMVAMSWDHAKEQRETAYKLALQHGLAFFDISDTSGLYYPDGWKLMITDKQFQTEEADEEYNKTVKKLVSVFIVDFVLFCLLGITFITGDKQLNTLQIVLELIAIAVLATVILLLARAKKKLEKRLTETEKAKYKKMDINTSNPPFDILDDWLKTIIRNVPDTRLILYEHVREKNISTAWKEWALNMMEAGYETDGIVQLAGEDLTMNPFEFKKLASQIFNELDINVSPKLAYEQYVLWTAYNVINGEMTAKEGFELLTTAAVDTEYDDTFMPFYHLTDDFDMKVENEGYSNEDIEKMQQKVFMNLTGC